MDVIFERISVKDVYTKLLALAGAVAILTMFSQARAFDPLHDDVALTNPYCAVPTFISDRFNGQARAFLTKNKRPMIVVDQQIIHRTNLVHFLMAHECCHHTLGHLERRAKPIAAINGRAITTAAAEMELEADCCAARILSRQGDEKAIAAGRIFMERFGGMATGFGYPTGFARAHKISSCSSTPSKSAAPTTAKIE